MCADCVQATDKTTYVATGTGTREVAPPPRKINTSKYCRRQRAQNPPSSSLVLSSFVCLSPMCDRKTDLVGQEGAEEAGHQTLDC